MRVNFRKTQLLCISPDNGYDSWAAFNVGNEAICSQSTMKMLGFFLVTVPGVTAHVDALKSKFRARFWSLIHLRRAGIAGMRLFRLYAALVCPVLEANSVVYHSMLNKGQSEDIERMQRQVIRLCFGSQRPTTDLMEQHNIDALRTRRNNAVKKFIEKTLTSNPRFSDHWV